MSRFVLIVAGLVGFSASPAFAYRDLLVCQVTEVLDSNYLEESLSVEEYPDVTIGRGLAGREAYLGASLYSEGNGDRIENGPRVGTVVSFLITQKDSEDSIFVTSDVSIGQGSIQVRKAGDADFKKIAQLSCR